MERLRRLPSRLTRLVGAARTYSGQAGIRGTGVHSYVEVECRRTYETVAAVAAVEVTSAFALRGEGKENGKEVDCRKRRVGVGNTLNVSVTIAREGDYL